VGKNRFRLSRTEPRRLRRRACNHRRPYRRFRRQARRPLYCHVYAAGVKVGYSTFCPTCYTDCGKRARTGTDGRYRIESLDPALWFRLLVVGDGYQPTFVMKVDPAAGPVPDAGLPARAAVSDPARILRGRVVNPGGVPLRDALVRPEGIAVRKVNSHYRYDEPLSDADRLAVTNERGEFTIVHARPATAMTVMVEARGMAPKRFADLLMGDDVNTFTVTDGALVRGRLLQNGLPIGGAQMALSHRNQFMGFNFDAIQIGTQPDGAFVIPNVPAGEVWYLSARMDTIASRGAVQPVKVVTEKDGDLIDIGDLNIGLGLRLRGRVELSDGKPIPPGMEIRIAPGCSYCWEEMAIPMPAGFTTLNRDYQLFDQQTIRLSPDGRFEFKGLPTGPFRVSVAVQGYSVAPGFQVLPPSDMAADEQRGWDQQLASRSDGLRLQNAIEIMMSANVDNLAVRLVPAPPR
jgi:hypothetical protein